MIIEMRKIKEKNRNSRLLPTSLRIISSCIKTVSTNASTVVRTASTSVAASISSSGDDVREQVLWAGFDKLELKSTVFRHVLLLGYANGFQVFDVEDTSGLSELVSRRDGPVTFMQMLPVPANCDDIEKYKSSHPVLVIVGANEHERITLPQNAGQGPRRYSPAESSSGNSVDPHTAVRFYSMKSNEYVKVINFKSAVFLVRCSPRVVAIGLEEQVYCFDTLTLEKKFVVVTYPIPRVSEKGTFGINTGYGPMALGPRWLAYPPNSPFLLNTGRVSPKSLSASVSPSTSPGSGTLMARYAVESGKHLAAGLLSLGDMGYKKLSKYYPELLPDGPSSPGWKGGKLTASEPENAGVITVKDLVCSEVVAQFRAHTSPISALCFDPSGTLLVTASVHGNNINVFRIMPSHTCGREGSSDWSTSYVHLYKLHRGMTTAVIQDICFSNDSQWIAIVSSKGTCHIFVLSPFGGDDGFQALHAHGQGTSLFLASTTPWWSTSTFTINEQNTLPPPPCTLSVVSRIKCSDSGMLKSVSNAAASMAGKLWVPSGAVAATFHKSNSADSLDAAGNSLGHILVYTPSGFVVQHEILPSMGLELSESRTESLSATQVNPQNEELKVKVEPIKWWDVCRRVDNMEREDCISGSIFYVQNDHEIDGQFKMASQENVSAREKRMVTIKSLNSSERSHWHLSNAEVHVNSCRLPIWQKSKIHFHVMEPPKAEYYFGGEFEIEMATSHEVEIRRKDLLPVIGQFPSMRSGCIDRLTPCDRKHHSASSNGCQAGEKTNEASILYHSKQSSFSSTESSEGESSRQMDNVLDLDRMTIDRAPGLVSHSAIDLNTNLKSGPSTSFPSENASGCNCVEGNAAMSRSCSSGNETPSLNVDDSDSVADILMPSEVQKTVDFVQFFKEGYCIQPGFGDNCKSKDDVTDDIDTSGNGLEEKSEEEGWIGGMFDFSEEG